MPSAFGVLSHFCAGIIGVLFGYFMNLVRLLRRDLGFCTVISAVFGVLSGCLDLCLAFPSAFGVLFGYSFSI